MYEEEFPMSQGEYMRQAVNEWAWNYGAMHPDMPWICSDLDTWEKNPHYKCAEEEPYPPHPEDYCGGCGSYECKGECHS